MVVEVGGSGTGHGKGVAFDGNMESSSIIIGRQVEYMKTEADGWAYIVLGICRSSILIASIF